ncbi:hypothetical protein L7F22_059462 [Adiantum nelumboides]|nr:hypothetical protein [Adiantum nelumboides]
MRQTIPLPMSNAGCFGGGSVFQAMIRPSPALHGFMPDNSYGAMPPGGSNPMYGNIGVQPGFQCAGDSYGMPGANMGMAGFSQPNAQNLNMVGRPSGNFGSGMPLMNAPAYDNLTPKGKPKDCKEGGQAVKFDTFHGTHDKLKALLFLQQFDAAFAGGNFTEASKIRKAATFLKTNALQWWTTLLNQGVVPSTWVQFKQIFAPAWITKCTNTFEVDVMTAWNQLSTNNCESLEEYNAKFWDALLPVSSFKMGKPDEDGVKTRHKEPLGKQFSAKGNFTSRLTTSFFRTKTRIQEAFYWQDYWEDGTSEVQLGQTHIVCAVTCQLVQPYPDQPNEGSLVVYTEFSPMADPSFEVGRPGENAVELGRVIERGLRDSRAIDTESLCIVSGKAAWLLRVDIHVLDNGGNLIDAACFAALAALLSVRLPECGLAGDHGQDVVIYPPEVREPVPLIVHYLPISFTFGFFGEELVVMDPTYKEELLMRGRLTIILNVDGDICAIQKAGGIGVNSCDILHCLQNASTKIAEVTSSLRKAVEGHEFEKTHLTAKETLNFLEIKTVTEMLTIPEGRGLMHGNHVVANILCTPDVEASSDESSDSSTGEEGRQFAKVPWVPPLLSAPQTGCRKEMDEVGLDLITDYRAARVQGSDVDHRQLVSESETVSDLVSSKFERLSIERSAEVGNVERHLASASKGKPQSLLDAVKWENVKKRRADNTQNVLTRRYLSHGHVPSELLDKVNFEMRLMGDDERELGSYEIDSRAYL